MLRFIAVFSCPSHLYTELVGSVSSIAFAAHDALTLLLPGRRASPSAKRRPMARPPIASLPLASSAAEEKQFVDAVLALRGLNVRSAAVPRSAPSPRALAGSTSYTCRRTPLQSAPAALALIAIGNTPSVTELRHALTALHFSHHQNTLIDQVLCHQLGHKTHAKTAHLRV